MSVVKVKPSRALVIQQAMYVLTYAQCVIFPKTVHFKVTTVTTATTFTTVTAVSAVTACSSHSMQQSQQSQQ
jgi:hypothetical protein